MKFEIILLMLLLTGSSEGLFNGNTSTVSNKTLNRLNLTCFYYGSLVTNCEYCVYEFYSNGTSSSSFYDYMTVTNIYKSITQRCTGFSNITDIGFGFCSPLQFELFDISIFCICATDMCNMDFPSCQLSVNNQLKTNSAPSVLSSIIPELNRSISCYDSPNSLNTSYYCSDFASPYIDIEKCSEYTLNNTFLCMYQISNDVPFFASLTRDMYRYYLSGALSRVYQFNQESSITLSYNETSSSFYINYILLYQNGNNTISWNMERCFCSENYCNYNLTTCLTANRIITPI